MTEPLAVGELESAAAIAAAVRERRVSAGEMVERALERIERLDGPVNSCVRVLGDEALVEARRIDAGRERGGQLQGVPVTVKEIFDVAGERSTWETRTVEPLTAMAVECMAGTDAVGLVKLEQNAIVGDDGPEPLLRLPALPTLESL